MKQDDGLAQEKKNAMVATMEKERKSTPHVVKGAPAQAAMAAAGDEEEQRGLPPGGEPHPEVREQYIPPYVCIHQLLIVGTRQKFLLI